MESDTPTAEASKWRNLEPCDIIQEGDEVLSSKNGWIKARRIGQHPFSQSIYRTRIFAREADQIKELQAEVERLTDALESCWHAANTYDGNYTAACDNVMTIVNTTLKIANPEDK